MRFIRPRKPQGAGFSLANKTDFCMRQLLLLLIGLCWTAVGFSQRAITGTVTDPIGDPVIGATVLVTGTTTGTITDLDGNFEITVPEGNTSLTFSYIGYEPQTVEITEGSDVVDLTLSEGVALDEVVVTGYSTGTQREATGAISTISADKLSAIPSGNVEQQLQGRASGVTVISNGQPGTQSKVRVRGFGSFSNNQPLYVVDGVPSNNIDFLPPEDIESTSVLKDAASASIYGARAASGVIVVQTKRGSQDGGVRVSYDGLIGVTDPGQGRPILNPQQQAEVIYQGLRNDVFLSGGDPDTATYESSQYDFSDSNNIQLPDYILVGERTGVFGEPTPEEIAQYNDDLSVAGQPGIFLIQRANKEGTDWYDEITRQALLTRHNLGFSGGAERSKYYVGLSYQDQEGILINNDFKRYAFRANSEFEVIPNRLRVGENLQFTYISNLGQAGAGGGQGVANEEGQILSAFRLAPIIPSRTGADPDNPTGYGGILGNGSNFGNARNPLAEREGLANNTNNNVQTFGDIYAELDIIPGLFVKTLFGGQYGQYNGRGFGRATYENSENIGNNSYSEFNGTFGNWVWTNTLNFDFSIPGGHEIKGLVGYEANKIDFGYNTGASGTDPFLFTPEFASISQVAAQQVSSGFNPQKTFASVFGQINYNYDSKYYLTGVVRRDESSAFGATDRSGVFPAVSAAWRVTGEDFLQPGDVLSDLKIRGGYGVMGNSNAVPTANQFDLYGGNIATSAYDVDGTNSTARVGFIQTQIGNPDAKWEQSTTINIGADASFFDTRFDISLDLWQKKNTDVLFNVALPSVSGTGAAPFVNVATIDNKGIDLLLTYRDRRGEFDWKATVTGSWLNNQIVEVAPDLDFFDSGGQQRLAGTAVRNRVGQPISTFFGYQVAGLWQSFEEVEQANSGTTSNDGEFQSGAGPGRFRYADINGTDENGKVIPGPDGKIDASDRTAIGNAVPDFTGGLNLRVEFKGFDVETFLYTSIGNEILNNSKWYTDFLQSFTSGSAKSTDLLDAWSPTNTDSNIPILESTSNFSTNTQVNSYYIENGSYLRMRYLTVGYTLPQGIFGERISRARVSLSGNNLFTITGYSGLDPAVGGAADTNFGIDVGNYPVTKSFNFAISLGF